MSRRNGVNGRRRALYVWHRRIGLVAAALVLVLAVTGVLLNHAERLNLNQSPVDQAWLTAWYGMSPEGEAVSFETGGDWVTWLEGRVFLNGELVAENMGKLKGAAGHEGMIAAAAAEELLLISPEGRLIERLDSVSLPGRIEALGRGPGGWIVLRTADGRFRADADVVTWTRVDATPAWTRPSPAPAAVRDRVLSAYRGAGPSWNRVLLDLHTGRILGAWGPYLMDAAAVLLIVLGVTGFYTWLRTRR